MLKTGVAIFLDWCGCQSETKLVAISYWCKGDRGRCCGRGLLCRQSASCFGRHHCLAQRWRQGLGVWRVHEAASCSGGPVSGAGGPTGLAQRWAVAEDGPQAAVGLQGERGALHWLAGLRPAIAVWR